MAQESPHIEVDPAVLDDDHSDYASSGYDTSTASLTSSLNDYIEENGRRYHTYFGADKNLFPTDETELNRLDMHHEVMLLLLDRQLHKAPLKNPQRILDVGTGTGIWAIDMADRYPSAEVIGTDLSPTQPGWVPPNCKFEVDDAEQPWTYKPDSFDFIHARNVAQSITGWPKLLERAYKCIKPGGYIELAELGGVIHSDDNTMPDNHPVKTFCELLAEALGIMGRPKHVTGEDLKKFLIDTGFEDVVVYTTKQPWGPWPKDKTMKQAGAMTLLVSETGMPAYGMAAFTRVLGMSKEEADRRCKEAFKAVKDKRFHVYNYYYVVYGRKPEKSAE
ncbi:S-adenosyl-L-methionine-dependent methyltransferase [Wilcoxina mikolae CBS 423.85]|nr:S-adenosyl-L-methionine-dependent methyltransferase [Wilcoxina mikolae CBS 423.85]